MNSASINPVATTPQMAIRIDDARNSAAAISWKMTMAGMTATDATVRMRLTKFSYSWSHGAQT